VSSILLAAGLLAVFAAILLLLLPTVFAEREDPAVRRSLDAVGALVHPLEAGELRESELALPFVDRVLDPVLRHFVSLGRQFTPDERMQAVRHRLDLAGNPAGWDPDRVVGLKALACLVGLVLGLLLPPVFGVGPLPTVALVACGAVFGWYTPALWLYQLAYNRTESIRRDLPDALDLMTISVEAGLAFDAAMTQVARHTRGPLAKEFFRVQQEMTIGTSRADSMRALGERTDVSELKAFLGAMVQADDLGVPIAGVLRVQAGEMRVKRSQRAEELAQKVPVKIIFPLITCIMPCLFVVVMGPAAITLMQNFGGRGL
jgi:tight adherence protein C